MVAVTLAFQEAGLVTRRILGRTVAIRLRFQEIRAAMGRLYRYERYQSGGRDRFAALSERKGTDARSADR